MGEWDIQRLTSAHDRTAFSCGKALLDTFLVTLVSQYEKRRLGRTFVATEPGQCRVAGYYTLAAGAFDLGCLPPKDLKKLPKHPVPTVHLGRLAVDLAFRGKRLGETLLFHSRRCSVHRPWAAVNGHGKLSGNPRGCVRRRREAFFRGERSGNCLAAVTVVREPSSAPGWLPRQTVQEETRLSCRIASEKNASSGFTGTERSCARVF